MSRVLFVASLFWVESPLWKTNLKTAVDPRRNEFVEAVKARSGFVFFVMSPWKEVRSLYQCLDVRYGSVRLNLIISAQYLYGALGVAMVVT